MRPKGRGRKVSKAAKEALAEAAATKAAEEAKKRARAVEEAAAAKAAEEAAAAKAAKEAAAAAAKAAASIRRKSAAGTAQKMKGKAQAGDTRARSQRASNQPVGTDCADAVALAQAFSHLTSVWRGADTGGGRFGRQTDERVPGLMWCCCFLSDQEAAALRMFFAAHDFWTQYTYGNGALPRLDFSVADGIEGRAALSIEGAQEQASYRHSLVNSPQADTRRTVSEPLPLLLPLPPHTHTHTHTHLPSLSLCFPGDTNQSGPRYARGSDAAHLQAAGGRHVLGR